MNPFLETRMPPNPRAGASADPFAAASAFVLSQWRETGKTLSLEIQGMSMWPTLKPGDRVIVRLTPPSQLKPLDIIAFMDHGALVIHRLIRVKRVRGKRLYRQVGDNCLGWGWIAPDQALGKVIRISRRGRVLDLARPPWSWLDRVLALVFAARRLAKSARIILRRRNPEHPLSPKP